MNGQGELKAKDMLRRTQRSIPEERVSPVQKVPTSWYGFRVSALPENTTFIASFHFTELRPLVHCISI